MHFSISEATSSDIDDLVRLEKNVFNAGDGILDRRSFRYHIEKNRNLMLLARSDDPPHNLLGYILVLVNRKSARIYSLAVDDRHRKQGTGRALLQASIGAMEQRGINTIKLELRNTNTSAYRLYHSFGFACTGSRPDYYGPGEDAMIMTRTTHADPGSL